MSQPQNRPVAKQNTFRFFYRVVTMLFLLIFFSMIVAADVIGGIFSDLFQEKSDSQSGPEARTASLSIRIRDSALLSVATLLLALVFSGWQGVINWHTESSLGILVLHGIAGSVARALPAKFWEEPSASLATIEWQGVVRQGVIGAVSRHMALAMIFLLFVGSIFLFAIASGKI